MGIQAPATRPRPEHRKGPETPSQQPGTRTGTPLEPHGPPRGGRVPKSVPRIGPMDHSEADRSPLSIDRSPTVEGTVEVGSYPQKQIRYRMPAEWPIRCVGTTSQALRRFRSIRMRWKTRSGQSACCEVWRWSVSTPNHLPGQLVTMAVDSPLGPKGCDGGKSNTTKSCNGLRGQMQPAVSD